MLTECFLVVSDRVRKAQKNFFALGDEHLDINSIRKIHDLRNLLWNSDG